MRYLQDQVTGVRTAQVINHRLTVTFTDGRVQEQDVPPAVQDFLDAFNRGQYPDLLLP